MLNQVQKQLNKLIDVVQIVELSAYPLIERELVLIKVSAVSKVIPEILSMVNTFRASVVDKGLDNMIIEVVGDQDKINSFIELLKPYGILELTHTGLTAMARGEVNQQEGFPEIVMERVVSYGVQTVGMLYRDMRGNAFYKSLRQAGDYPAFFKPSNQNA
ncbi:acetolactate synthase small subunit [Paenibacillus glycanilyticus]|nr:acetolactate synthase small subunit [Paenibacillus glycanilyticus]